MIAAATAAVLSFAYIGVFRYWTPIDREEFLSCKHRRNRVLRRFRDGRRVYAQTGKRHEFSAQFAGNTLRDDLLDNNNSTPQGTATRSLPGNARRLLPALGPIR